MAFISNLSKQQNLLTSTQAIIIGLLILTFPYNTCDCTVGTLSILSFIVMLFQRSFDYKVIFKEKIVIVLLVFILFTYASVFWSHVPMHAPNSDFHAAFDRFKYYFLLIPAIYFSNFSKKTIKNLLYLIVIAPLPLVIIYYLNYFGITHLYCKKLGGSSYFLMYYLVENIFILFAAIFLYILFLTKLKERKYLASATFLVILAVYSVALFVDPKMHARGVDITLFIIIFLGLFYIFPFEKVFFPSLLVVALASGVLLSNPHIQQGIHTFKEALNQHKYTGSWGHRLAYDIVGVKIFLKHPIFGNGIDDVSTEIIQYKKIDPRYFKGEMYLTRLHNGHLLLLGQVGIVGYLLFLYFIYLMLRLKLSDPTIEIFKNLFIISFLLIMLTEQYLTLKFSTNLFAIVIALILLNKHIEQKSKLSQK